MARDGSVSSSASVLEAVVAQGDLRSLTAAQRTAHYEAVCQSLGLNPLTGPFQYVTLSGRLVLYATRGAADQLRALHGVSIEVVSSTVEDDCAVVHVRGRTPDGRTDEEFGIVPVGGLRGEALANARLKAVTKAKRRLTLGLCGLGWLDETELPADAATEPAPVTRATLAAPASAPAPAKVDDASREAMASALLEWRAVRGEAATYGVEVADLVAELEDVRRAGALTAEAVLERADVLRRRVEGRSF